MVWINDRCINETVPKGVFGGAMCICPKCKNKRYAEEEKARERTLQMLKEMKTPIEDYLEDILP